MKAPIANYICIAADKRINSFMHAADLFEAGKVMGFINRFTATYAEGTELTLQRAERGIIAMAEAKQTEYVVSLLHLDFIIVDNVITINDGRIKPYWNKGVRVISDGHIWYCLDSFLRKLGYKVETDEHRYITQVL